MPASGPLSRTRRLAALPENERRDLILKAAADLFAVKRYGGTSMGEIAARLDVRASSLYTYFPSKQDLLDEMSLATMRRSNARLRHALSLDDDVTLRAVRAMESQVRTRMEYPTHLIALSHEMQQLSPAVRTEVLDILEDSRMRWMQLVDEGVRAGRFVVRDPYVTALIIIGFFDFVQVRTFWIDERRPADELVQHYTSAVVKLLTAGRAAPASAPSIGGSPQ